MTSPDLNDLPFLKSICWQGNTPSIANLTPAEILSLYERNWHYHGTIATLSDTERQWLLQLAIEHRSWLVNKV
jgi:hypothetical protein